MEKAVKSWKSKYPTSKVDDCAVVCFFLDSNEYISSASKAKENIVPTAEEEDAPSTTGLNPVDENGEATEANEDEADEEYAAGHNWSALEGVSRVNTLITLPRFVPGKDDIKAAEERKGRK